MTIQPTTDAARAGYTADQHAEHAVLERSLVKEMLAWRRGQIEWTFALGALIRLHAFEEQYGRPSS